MSNCGCYVNLSRCSAQASSQCATFRERNQRFSAEKTHFPRYYYKMTVEK